MHSPQPSSTPRPRAQRPCRAPREPVSFACAPAARLHAQLGRVMGTVTVLQYSPCPASVTIQSIVLRYTPAQQPVAIHWLSCNTIFPHAVIQNLTTTHPRLQYNLLYCNTTSSQAYLLLQYNNLYCNIVSAAARLLKSQYNCCIVIQLLTILSHCLHAYCNTNIIFFPYLTIHLGSSPIQFCSKKKKFVSFFFFNYFQ